VRPWTENITFPVLIDQQHALTELYAISNVPTVIWIDEDDRIVRPNTEAYGTDTFKKYTGIEAGPHFDLLRRWVVDGQQPMSKEAARMAVSDLDEDEVGARLHFRVAAYARRNGDTATAAKHFARAGELAPFDWTIRRAMMPLVGEDPFGEKFMAMYQEWDEVGRPYHGIPGEKSAAG
jgi:hypothetical protein